MSNAKKNHVIAFAFMLILAVFAFLLTLPTHKQGLDYIMYYLLILIGSFSILLLPRIWFVFSPKRLLRTKIAICNIFTSLAIVIAIPIILFALVLRLCGFIKIIQYMEIFIASFIIAIILSIIELWVLANVITLYPEINQIAVLLLISFIVARIVMSLMIKLLFYIEKKKLRNASLEENSIKEKILIDDYKVLKKEINILIYGLIALSTGVISLVNWDIISTDAAVKAINDGMLTALALYTAVEAIGDKWKDRMGVE